MGGAPGSLAGTSKVQKWEFFPKNSCFRNVAYARMAPSVTLEDMPIAKPESSALTVIISPIMTLMSLCLIAPGEKERQMRSQNPYERGLLMGTSIGWRMASERGERRRWRAGLRVAARRPPSLVFVPSLLYFRHQLRKAWGKE